MKLAIQTSSGVYRAAVLRGADVVAERTLDGPARSTRDLGGLVAACLTDAACAPREIDTVAADLGPGGLASTRCGVSFANSFAYASGAALQGVVAFDLLRWHVAVTDRPVLCLRPATGGRVHWAHYGEETRSGCDPLAQVMARFDLKGRVLAGALERLPLEPFDVPAENLRFENTAGSEGFAHVPVRPPDSLGGHAVLQPLTHLERGAHG